MVSAQFLHQSNYWQVLQLAGKSRGDAEGGRRVGGGEEVKWGQRNRLGSDNAAVSG